jgi:prephenate dehydrogenase
MIPDTRIAIIGLGLMGGSLARAVSSRGAHVLGYDRQPDYLASALREGVVHEELDASLTGVTTAEVVVLAIPADAVCALLPSLSGRLADARLVMDLASTKRGTVAAAESAGIGAGYIGAHPLTGSHRSGWGVSRASLFENARVFLCPTETTSAATLERAESFWRELHAGVEQMEAGVHDDEMAWRSHLPHLVSSALAVTLRAAGIRRSALGPGGRDMTRLAGGSPPMWTGIARENATAICVALEAYEDQLRAIRAAVARGEPDAIRHLLVAGREWFDGEPDAMHTSSRADDRLGG